MEDVEYGRMRAVEDRHWWYAALHDLVVRFVCAERNRLRRPPRIVDAGCGTGRMAERLGGLGEVTACDLHPLALAAARARGLPRVLACDLAEEAPGCAEFDIAVCLDVIYHRRVASEAALLEHLGESLRPGGLLLLHAPAFEWLRGAHDLAVHTRRRFRRPEIAGLLAAAGFRVEYATYRLPLLVLPLLVRRAWSRRRVARRPGAVPPSDLAEPGGLDRWLAALAILENRLMCAGLRLPVGTSVFAVARRPPAERIQPPAVAPRMVTGCHRLGRTRAGARA